MKFPTPEIVRIFKGSQVEVRECYNKFVRIIDKNKRSQIQTMMVGVTLDQPKDMDPKEPQEPTSGPIEELYDLRIDVQEPAKVLKLGKNLEGQVKEELELFLKNNLDMFAWKHSNMVGIVPEVMCYRLNIDLEKNWCGKRDEQWTHTNIKH